jgi:hypothetical protein
MGKPHRSCQAFKMRLCELRESAHIALSMREYAPGQTSIDPALIPRHKEKMHLF